MTKEKKLSTWSIIEAIFAIIGLIALAFVVASSIGGYIGSNIVHYSFVVPQKYNATYFTLGVAGKNQGVFDYTVLPYTYKDWDWKDHTITFDVSYYVFQNQTVDFLDNSTNLAVSSVGKYLLVGRDLYPCQIVNDFSVGGLKHDG